MKKLLFLLPFLLLLACKSNEPKNIIPNPEGTREIQMIDVSIATSILTDYASSINNAIYVNGVFYGDNWGDNYALFCSVGKIPSLGCITEIPTNAVWTDNTKIANSIYIEKGYGYIANINGIYYRLFVKDIREEKFGPAKYDIMYVYTIDYQFPFIVD